MKLLCIYRYRTALSTKGMVLLKVGVESWKLEGVSIIIVILSTSQENWTATFYLYDAVYLWIILQSIPV